MQLVLEFILQIVIVLFFVKLAGHISVILGQPSVLGKIIVGILLGPAVLGWVHHSEVLEVFSEIGVLLLMFLAGLEANLKELNNNMKAALLVAVGGVVAPILMTYWIAQMFGFTVAEAIGQTKFKEEIEHKVDPIANGLFIPFFFVSIGLSVTFDGIGSQVGFLVVFTIIALLSKLLGCGLGAKLSGFNFRSSLGIGAGMVSRGEVALILATMGLENDLLHPEYYTSAIIVVILTTVVTPPMLKLIFGNRHEEAASVASGKREHAHDSLGM